MKVYFIAGEASGDLIGSKIIAHLKSYNQGINFLGIGGALMLSAGLKDSLFSMEEISIFGFFEVLPKIFKFKKLINKTVADIIATQPNIVVTIDSPGFCFRIVERIKILAPQIIRMHIVAPSVWAYKPERAIKVASLYNHLLTLLPFEAPLFEKHGLKTTYIGHPIFEQDFEQDFGNKDLTAEQLKDRYNTKGLNIALTPGSRASEIKRHLPVFAQALVGLKFLSYCTVVADNKAHWPLIEKILKSYKLKYFITQNKLAAFKTASLVLAKSGTNTLEIAACRTPMIVIYKLNILSWWFLKLVFRLKYVSLINIIASERIIPELLQNEATAENLIQNIKDLLDKPNKAQNQVVKAQVILRQMGLSQDLKPSNIAADTIFKSLLLKDSVRHF